MIKSKQFTFPFIMGGFKYTKAIWKMDGKKDEFYVLVLRVLQNIINNLIVWLQIKICLQNYLFEFNFSDVFATNTIVAEKGFQSFDWSIYTYKMNSF